MSRVQQGTGLGPLLFVVYVNGLPCEFSSYLQECQPGIGCHYVKIQMVFVADSRGVLKPTPSDVITLQADLDMLVEC